MEISGGEDRIMYGLAPGNILQALHFRRRLQAFRRKLGRPPKFIEIGAGGGWLSQVALAEGCSGRGYDLNPESCQANARRNSGAIAEGRYRVLNERFSTRCTLRDGPVNLVFSSMVLEHLTRSEIRDMVQASRAVCRTDGVFAAFVPAGMRYWGIEDEIAGHRRRYEIPDIEDLARRENLQLRYWTGLTFPISNLLRLPSNWLVARAESARLGDSMEERTIASGHRDVLFKTRYPVWLRWLLNRWTLWPFDVLQRLFGRSGRSMVLYCEWDLFPTGSQRERASSGPTGDHQAASAEAHRPTTLDVADLGSEERSQGS